MKLWTKVIHLLGKAFIQIYFTHKKCFEFNIFEHAICKGIQHEIGKLKDMLSEKDLRKETKKMIDTIDDRMLLAVHSMLKKDSEHDWWNELSPAEMASIKKGLKDIKEGKVTRHEDVMKRYKKWLVK